MNGGSHTVGDARDTDPTLMQRTTRSGPTGTPPNALLDDLIPGTSPHYLPRYQMPSISSILPEYSNSESEYIANAFNQGSYNSIHALPAHLRCHEVNKMRSALMEAVRQPLPGKAPTDRATGSNGLFQEYEYVPSQYNREDMLQERERLMHHAARAQVSEKEWHPTGNYRKGDGEDGFVPNQFYPYQSNPYEAAKDMILRHMWMEEQKVLHGPWASANGAKVLAEPPGPLMRQDIVKTLHRVISEDWEDVQMIFGGWARRARNPTSAFLFRVRDLGVLNGLESAQLGSLARVPVVNE